jgi:hypothetical protein
VDQSQQLVERIGFVEHVDSMVAEFGCVLAQNVCVCRNDDDRQVSRVWIVFELTHHVDTHRAVALHQVKQYQRRSLLLDERDRVAQIVVNDNRVALVSKEDLEQLNLRPFVVYDGDVWTSHATPCAVPQPPRRRTARMYQASGCHHDAADFMAAGLAIGKSDEGCRCLSFKA